jgi:hypothetical protein
MIIEVTGGSDTYTVSTDSLANPGNSILVVVRPETSISRIIEILNEARGRPK